MLARLVVMLPVVAIASVTLVPATSDGGGSGAICILCGERGLADFLANMPLFAPLGWGLALRGWGLIAGVCAGAVFSFGIEFSQIFLIAGRDASVGDLLSNSSGTAAGWALAQTLWVRPVRGPVARSAVSAGGAAAAAVGLLLVGGWLFRPSAPPALYYLQWTPDLGNLGVYEGRVEESALGPLQLPGPPGPIEQSQTVAQLIEAGAELRAETVAGPSPDRLSPIVSIYDGRQRELVLLGAVGDDFVYRYSTLGARLRLSSQQARFEDALQAVGPGEGVMIGASASEIQVCGGVGDDLTCDRGYGAGESWRHLYSPSNLPALLEAEMTAGWLTVLLLPAGMLAPDWRHRTAMAGAAAATLLVVPPLVSLAAIPVWQAILVAAAVLAGGAVETRRIRIR